MPHEGDESGQRLAGIGELEAQVASHPQVLLNGLMQGVHRAPLGHGSAKLRSAWMSTFV